MRSKSYDYMWFYLKSNRITYKEYLETEHWKTLRRRFLDTHDTCYCCGAIAVRFEVHHNTYKNIGNEKMSDLRLVCSPCHTKIHHIEQTLSSVDLEHAAQHLKRKILRRKAKKSKPVSWLR